jgi:amino acid transporter
MSGAAAPQSGTDDAAGPQQSDIDTGGQRLGPFLCWAIVFADIGTSVYYTPGILFHQSGVGRHAALFVSLTLLVFVLLTRKYAEVAVRYPEGGGVVTVAARAIHPFAGLLGGMFILVDYFLTAALSALSGIIYLSDVAPGIGSLVLPITVGALLLLAVLNLVGIGASATVNAGIAVLAAISQLGVVLAVIVHVGPGQLVSDLSRVLNGPSLTPGRLLTGYAGAFLAFSGLESISQLSPVMAEPRARVAALAMRALIATMILTSPLLTLWATTVLPIGAHTDPNQFISLLGGYAAGRAAEIEVAVSAALLLVFASNTALIGSYHVFLALSRIGFLPPLLAQRNHWRHTPQWAILVATIIPVLVLLLTQGSVVVLGDLYAFGLLGAFSLTCASLDIVRWHERHQPSHSADTQGKPEPTAPPPHRIGPATFVLGLLTTALVTLAWTVNLVAKPLATLFGGGVTIAGLVVGLTTYGLGRQRGNAPVLPLVHHPDYPAVFLHGGRLARPSATVLAILPSAPAQVGALVAAAQAVTARDPIVFLYHGRATPSPRTPELFEVVSPYLDDQDARAAFAEADRLARAHGRTHRYLYLPVTANGPAAVARFWARLQPKETLAVVGDEALLADLPSLSVRRSIQDHVSILHYLLPPPARTESGGSVQSE